METESTIPTNMYQINQVNKYEKSLAGNVTVHHAELII